MFHLHRLHHGQRLAGLDRLAGTRQEGDDLARHGRGQAAFDGAFAGVGQRVDLVQGLAALRREHRDALALGINRERPALLAQAHVVAVAAERAAGERSTRATRRERQRAAVVAVQRGLLRLAGDVEIEAACRAAEHPPAVAVRPGVAALQRVFERKLARDDPRRGARDRQRRLLEQRRALALDQRGIEVGAGEGARVHDAAQEGHIGVQADDVRGAQRCVEPGQRLGARIAPDDQLGDHRVVVRADGVALVEAAIDARGRFAALEADMRRPARHLHRAGGRQEVGVGVLGADAGLDRVAGQAQVGLRHRQRLAGGDAQLPLDQILPGHGLGHRVLDLQPRVHLHEVGAEVAVCECLGDEFDGAGADIADRLGRRHGRGTELGPARFAQARRRRLFEHLLVPPLHRAVALGQMDAPALAVGEDLDLDVPRPRDVALDEHMVVAETGLRFALARSQGGSEVGGCVDTAHALATAPGAGLDQHRKADAFGLAGQQGRVVVAAVVAGHQRHTGFFHQRLGGRLAAHRADGAGRRADEDQARVAAGLRELGVFGQKAVAGVHRLRAGALGCGEDAPPVEVAFARRRGADVHRLVAGPHMARTRVGVRVDSDGANAHAPRGGRDAARDLAAVGNQNLLEHVRLPRLDRRSLRSPRNLV